MQVFLSFSFRCCGDVVSGIVTKVLNARPKSKQLGIDICLMYVENEKQDVVVVSANSFSHVGLAGLDKLGIFQNPLLITDIHLIGLSCYFWLV